MEKEKTTKMINDWKIEMFTLQGCEKCETLKRDLNTNNIPYSEHDVTTNPFLGDRLEEMYKCEGYPMVIFKGTSQIIWLPESFLLPSPNIRIYNSIPELIQNIKSTLKK